MWAFDAGGPPQHGSVCRGGEGRFAVPDGCGTTPPFAVWRLVINGISPSGPCPRPGIRAGRPGSATVLVPGGFIHVFCGIAKRTAIMVARKQRRRDGRPSKQPVPPARSQSISQCRKHRQHDFDWEHEHSSKHRHPEKFLLLVVLPVLVRDPVGSSSSGSVALTRPPSCGGPCPGTHCWIRCRPGHSCPAH